MVTRKKLAVPWALVEVIAFFLRARPICSTLAKKRELCILSHQYNDDFAEFILSSQIEKDQIPKTFKSQNWWWWDSILLMAMVKGKASDVCGTTRARAWGRPDGAIRNWTASNMEPVSQYTNMSTWAVCITHNSIPWHWETSTNADITHFGCSTMCTCGEWNKRRCMSVRACALCTF